MGMCDWQRHGLEQRAVVWAFSVGVSVREPAVAEDVDEASLFQC